MQNKIVELKNIRFSFGANTVLTKLSWSLGKGEHWAILGSNGHGKSTFLKIIAGELQPDKDSQGEQLGTRLWNFEAGVANIIADAFIAKENIAFVSPELQTRYQTFDLNLTGLELIESGFGDSLFSYNLITAAQSEIIKNLSEQLQTTSLLERQISTLSQGQLRILLLLRALVKKPRLLILDEPTDGLDAQAFINFNKAVEIAIANGASIILATHNQEELLPCLTHFFELNKGEIINSGSMQNLEAKAFSPNTLSANGITINHDKISDVHATQHAKQLPLISLSNADVFIAGAHILHKLNWQLEAKQNWVISGNNGSGKTSFIRLIRGDDLFPAFGGELRWQALESEPNQRPSLSEIQQKFALVSDRLQTEYQYDLNGIELILSGIDSTIGLYRDFSEQEQADASYWAKIMQLEEYLNLPMSKLSTGTLRRFFMARALISKPLVLLLDEPCSGLDKNARLLFMNVLSQVLENGQQALYISHRPNELTAKLKKLFNNRMHFNKGKLSILN